LLENHCTRQLCRAMKVVRYTQKLNMDAFTSPLLEDTSASTDSLTDAETTFSYVPQRNLIMAAYALGYAEQLGLGGIALGMNLSDASAYPDNGVPFLEGLNNITPYSSNWGSNLKVSAPLVNMMKSEIVKLGLYLGVPFPYVCSCYYPKLEGDLPVYCGKCGSDLLYKAAWNKLGYDPPNLGLEPTLYKSPPTVEMKDSYKVSDLPFYSVFKLNL
jgi:7-cyano-7-deazaguanine synthase